MVGQERIRKLVGQLLVSSDLSWKMGSVGEVFSTVWGGVPSGEVATPPLGC